jgi:hypothetical protein
MSAAGGSQLTAVASDTAYGKVAAMRSMGRPVRRTPPIGFVQCLATVARPCELRALSP